MLAMSGADLNAKNKNDETPSGKCLVVAIVELKSIFSFCFHLVNNIDICEDAEVRERIEQLKSEQESKRLAEAQRRRVRRSQSNNTR